MDDYSNPYKHRWGHLIECYSLQCSYLGAVGNMRIKSFVQQWELINVLRVPMKEESHYEPFSLHMFNSSNPLPLKQFS